MEKNREVVDKYDKLDMRDKFIVVEAMRTLNPIVTRSLDETRSDIYHLPDERLDFLILFINMINRYSMLYEANREVEEELLEFVRIGSKFFRIGD